MISIDRQACFNELSLLDLDGNEEILPLFENFAQTIKMLKRKGFNGIRYEHGITSLMLDEKFNIFDLQNYAGSRDLYVFILTTARSPYIEADTKEEERYINEDYEVNVCGTWCEGKGFISAYLLKTVVISLNTHPKWEKPYYLLRSSNNKQKTERVLNLVSPESSKTEDFCLFVENLKPLILVQCVILPENKEFKVRKDHGSDKLKELWTKLRNCEYVVSVINSLEFNRFGVDFIEKCFDDGKIHIRLVNSDAGYGMVIQTTGRNKGETIKIGKIIRERYFKRK